MRIHRSMILFLMTKMSMEVSSHLEFSDQTHLIADPNDEMEDVVTRNLQNVVFYAPTCPKANNISLYDGTSSFAAY
jgi:hypothetical protein